MFFGRPIRQSSLECSRQVVGAPSTSSPSQQLGQQQQHCVGCHTQLADSLEEAESQPGSLLSLASLKSSNLVLPAAGRLPEARTLTGRTHDNKFELRYELANELSSSGGQPSGDFQHQDKQRPVSSQMDSSALAPGSPYQSRIVKPRELSYADDGIR